MLLESIVLYSLIKHLNHNFNSSKDKKQNDLWGYWGFQLKFLKQDYVEIFSYLRHFVSYLIVLETTNQRDSKRTVNRSLNHAKSVTFSLERFVQLQVLYRTMIRGPCTVSHYFEWTQQQRLLLSSVRTAVVEVLPETFSMIIRKTYAINWR